MSLKSANYLIPINVVNIKMPFNQEIRAKLNPLNVLPFSTFSGWQRENREISPVVATTGRIKVANCLGKDKI
jgi:hypothetical protein